MKNFCCLVVFVFCLAAPHPAAALNFSFTYNDPAGTGFNDAVLGATRQGAMQSAAGMLAGYFINYNATVAFTVNSSNVAGGILASAWSNPFSSTFGFTPTIAQNLILTGNGTSDARINFNFAHPWDYDDVVAADAFDFKSVVIHEILHSLGFISYVNSSGQGAHQNASGQPDTWSSYDRFLVNNSGTALVDGAFAFETSQLSTLTGGSQGGVYLGNGVFFNGAFASAALGQNIPIYSPDPWEAGSSMHHTDDTFFSGIGQPVLIMNAATDTGALVRSLSAIEIGMLRDIGYADIVPEPAPWTLLLILTAFGLAMQPRRRPLRRA